MRPKLIDGKYVITKCGFYLLDEEGKIIYNQEGNPLLFPEKSQAEKYLKDNQIIGTVK
jgi:hypothetical protein